MLACANAVESYKYKLLVIGKSLHWRAFKGVRIYPVNYRAKKRAWITTDITRLV